MFSVVIPTYNRADRILPTLKSVQNQTRPDFECLVIDDGSSDGEKLARVVASLDDSRFKYVRKENGGACSARNLGFDLAAGDFVALLDSDDCFVPEKLERAAAELAKVRGDVLLYSRFIVNRGIDKVWIKPPRGLGPNERIDEYLMCTPGATLTSTMVLPTSLARRVRFDENLPSSQDTDFSIRVANAGARIIFIDEPLAVFDDSMQHTRVSKGSNYKDQLAWIETMRGTHISDRAYWAYRGWQCARIASYSNRPYALGLYLKSAIRGVYPPRQGAVIAAQVLIPRSRYQSIANIVVSLLGRKDRRQLIASQSGTGGN